MAKVHIERLLLYFSRLTLFVLICTLVWCAFRSFDITDEAFYLLSFQHPEQSRLWSAFHIIIGWPTRWFHPSVSFYRLLKIPLGLLTGLYLAKAVVLTWPRRITLSSLAAVIVTGNFLGSSYLPQTPAYNDLIQWLTETVIASLLIVSFGVSTNQRRAAALSGGFFLALAFGAKFPSAIILFFISLTYLAFTLRTRAKEFIVFCLAFSMGLACLISLCGGIPAIRRFLDDYTMLTSSTSHGIKLVLERYFAAFLPLIRAFIFALPAFASLTFFIFRRGLLEPKRIFVFSVISILLLGIALQKHWLYASPYPQVTWMLNLALVFVSLGLLHFAYSTDENKGRRPKALVITFLFLAPLICSFGTSNDLPLQTFFHIAPWLAFPVLLLPEIKNREMLELAIGELLSLVFCVLIICGVLFHPYRTAPLIEQTQWNSRLGVLLDPPTNAFFAELDAKVPLSTTQNSPILFFYDGPGIIYFLESYSLGEQWYFRGLDPRTCDNIRKGKDQIHLVNLIFTDDDLSPLVADCLRDAGVRLNGNFRLSDSIKNPYRESKKILIWKRND